MTRTTLAALAIAAALMLAGCGHHGHAAAMSSAGARASALATSTAAQAGKKDAKTLLAHCIPSSASGQVALATSASAREAVMKCAGVPKGQRQAAAQCALTRIENGGKLPAGRQAKELALLNDAWPCVQKYQGSAR